MKNLIGKYLGAVLLTASLSTAYAAHDNGQGKSQDHPKDALASVSVAPEPSTFWLFLAGSLAIALYSRRRKSMG